MDIYFPRIAPKAAPVLVFLHGGGFRRGEPSYNGYVGRPYLERGAVFVSMGYRLLPDVRVPDTCEDVELGLQWLLDHAMDLNADADRVYLAGASAGAVLAALTTLRDWSPNSQLPPGLIKVLVIISGGMWDFARHLDGLAEFSNPESQWWVPDLTQCIERVPDQTVVVWGERDLPVVLHDSPLIVAAIRAHGDRVEEFIEPDADHYAAVDGFAHSGRNVARSVATLMRLPGD
ncbi:MAG: alpha/beta hydrolase [Chloroflexi bacterium]|nr:alpha/beta hydrolase [Chloroflexota bacterium]